VFLLAFYSFLCKQRNHKGDILQRFTIPLPVCSHSCASSLQKLFRAFTFVYSENDFSSVDKQRNILTLTALSLVFGLLFLLFFIFGLKSLDFILVVGKLEKKQQICPDTLKKVCLVAKNFKVS